MFYLLYVLCSLPLIRVWESSYIISLDFWGFLVVLTAFMLFNCYIVVMNYLFVSAE